MVSDATLRLILLKYLSSPRCTNCAVYTNVIKQKMRACELACSKRLTPHCPTGMHAHLVISAANTMEMQEPIKILLELAIITVVRKLTLLKQLVQLKFYEAVCRRLHPPPLLIIKIPTVLYRFFCS